MTIKNWKFNRWAILILSALLLAGFFPATVKADTGPKPSVQITFEHMGDEICYGTLLSETAGSGPYSVWDGTEAGMLNYNEIDEQVWRKFVEYEDSDGFYFIQGSWLCSETKSLEWTYYPPETFKVLLYYPERDAFVVSEIYQQYAFDSYYTVDLADIDFDSTSGETLTLVATQSYDLAGEAKAMAGRVVLTLALELAVAVLFGLLRTSKAAAIILCINLVTQAALNLALNAIAYYHGTGMIVLYYVVLELAVFVVEALAYQKAFGADTPSKKIITYAFVANAVSFGVGLVLAGWLPEIF